MDNLTTFFTSMLALSIGVERIVEITKQMIPFLRADPDPRLDRTGSQAAQRRWMLQLLASAVGTFIAAVIGPQLFIARLEGADPLPRVGACVLLGLMSSGGSALWNHALDIVGAIKGVRESIANGTQPGQQQQAQQRVELPIGP